MFNPYGYPQPIVVWPPNGQRNDDEMNIETYFKIKKILDEEAKSAKEKDKKKPEAPKFTLLEAFGMNLITLPFFGACLYFGLQLFR